MSGTKKCAHAACNCQVPDGQKYCSAKCESAKKMTELMCQCGHPGCTGGQMKA
jgi:hypothetical protein